MVLLNFQHPSFDRQVKDPVIGGVALQSSFQAIELLVIAGQIYLHGAFPERGDHGCVSFEDLELPFQAGNLNGINIRFEDAVLRSKDF